MSAVRCHVILIRRAHVGDPGGGRSSGGDDGGEGRGI
jgi:hypothetical protein